MKIKIPEFRQDYVPGDIFFVRHKSSFISDGIIFFENRLEVENWVAESYKNKNWSEKSHVVMVADRKRGFECDEAGVHWSYLDKYLNGDYDVVVRRPRGLRVNTCRARMIPFFEERFGRIYNFTAYPGYLVERMFLTTKYMRFMRKVPVLGWFPGLYVCSTFCAAVLRNCHEFKHWLIFKAFHISRISPRILWYFGEWKPLLINEEV